MLRTSAGREQADNQQESGYNKKAVIQPSADDALGISVTGPQAAAKTKAQKPPDYRLPGQGSPGMTLAAGLYPPAGRGREAWRRLFSCVMVKQPVTE